jgi:hypothetical protein
MALRSASEKSYFSSACGGLKNVFNKNDFIFNLICVMLVTNSFSSPQESVETVSNKDVFEIDSLRSFFSK